MKKIVEYLTIKEAAKMIGVSEGTLRNWDRSGKLKARRNPHSLYRLYKRADLLEFLEKIEQS